MTIVKILRVIYLSYCVTTPAKTEIFKMIWDVENAESIKTDQDLGHVNPIGTQGISPDADIRHTLQPTNRAGSSEKSVQVKVIQKPIIKSFLARDPVIPSSTNTKLKVEVDDAESVFIDNDIGFVEQSGTEIISPHKNMTYTLTEENRVGSTSSSTSINVCHVVSGDRCSLS